MLIRRTVGSGLFRRIAIELWLFRRKPEGWRHILYAQCPLGPDTYVRALRQRIVRDDFAAFAASLADDA